jgi:hypothetical protein
MREKLLLLSYSTADSFEVKQKTNLLRFCSSINYHGGDAFCRCR